MSCNFGHHLVRSRPFHGKLDGVHATRDQRIHRPPAARLTGHKTESVFERYNITSPDDLRDAVRRLEASK
jgi:hypothetical protein